MSAHVINKHADYLGELTTLYNGIGESSFDLSSSDNSFTVATLALLDLHAVELQDVKAYCQFRESDVKRALRKVALLDFQYPAVLLLFYYIEYYDRFLAYNWPFSLESFRKVRSYLGLAASPYV